MDEQQSDIAVRITFVDIAKGFGIFLIILGHLITYGHPIFKWIFSFHIPLFFFLSGYVFKAVNTCAFNL